ALLCRPLMTVNAGNPCWARAELIAATTAAAMEPPALAFGELGEPAGDVELGGWGGGVGRGVVDGRLGVVLAGVPVVGFDAARLSTATATATAHPGSAGPGRRRWRCRPAERGVDDIGPPSWRNRRVNRVCHGDVPCSSY